MAAVIDISLAAIPFIASADKKQPLSSYLEALSSCGVDFFEIKPKVIPLVEKEELEKRFILRISDPSEFPLCKSMRFAYVSVPISLSRYFKELSEYNNIIAEVSLCEHGANDIIKSAATEECFRYITMLRVLTDELSLDGEDIAEFVKSYRSRCVIPLDICPKNNRLTGFICISSALNAGTDCVTLAYGCDYIYSSLEEFYINSNMARRTFMPEKILSGICAAGSAFINLFEKLPSGIERMTELKERLEAPVYDLESGLRFFPYRSIPVPKKQPADAVRKKIKELGYDERTEEYIMELLRMARLTD